MVTLMTIIVAFNYNERLLQSLGVFLRSHNVNFGHFELFYGLIFCGNVSRKCEICIEAKMTKKPFPKAESSSQLLDLIHYDIFECNVF